MDLALTLFSVRRLHYDQYGFAKKQLHRKEAIGPQKANVQHKNDLRVNVVSDSLRCKHSFFSSPAAWHVSKSHFV